MRDIKHIVVHCSATPEGRPHTAVDITRWHKAQGYSTIGYHWVVRLDGTVEPGRDELAIGSHVKGFNSHSIGVVYVGGVDKVKLQPKDTRTKEQKAALLKLLKELKRRYPKAVILGHRDFANVRKACPSFSAKAEYEGL